MYNNNINNNLRMASSSKEMSSDNKRKNEDTEQEPQRKKKSIAEFVLASDFKGRLPCAIACTFYDTEKKHPFMCSFNLKSASFSPMIIYSIMQHYKITELKYNSIYLYGFRFIEPGVEHPTIVINDEICGEALSECEKQKFIPFEKPSNETEASATPDIKTDSEEIPEGSPSRSLDKYDDIIKKVDNIGIKIIKENETDENTVIISNSFILCYFFKKIINTMNEKGIQIKAEPYTIIEYKEPDFFSVMLNNMLTNVMCGK